MEHRSEFLGWLRKQGVTEAQSEDLFQSALMRAMEPWAELPPDDRLVPWFYRVLRNAMVDQARRTAAAGRAIERYANEPVPGGEPAEARRICGCTRLVLASLKPDYARLIELVDVTNVAVEDAAHQLGITTNNAYVRLHRARRALRDRLETMCGKCATGGGRCTDCYCQPAEPL
jgi:RNA polymerase sigma-70 factor (ECF subfamily)